LVLITEEYEGRDEIKKQVSIRAAFDPETKLMADEIINKITTPAALDALTQHITEKNEWHKPLKGQASAPAVQQPTSTSSQIDNPFEDEAIPF